MALKTYDPQEVTISLSGIIFKGFVEDEFVTVEHASESFEDVVGVDGEDVSRSKSGDRRATVTVKLMQTSDTNDLLSALLALDENTPGGAGVGAFYMRDGLGRTVLEGPQAWLMGPPAIAFGKVAGPREWKVRIAKRRLVVGGN
jgi:hypothetical protein